MKIRWVPLSLFCALVWAAGEAGAQAPPLLWDRPPESPPGPAPFAAAAAPPADELVPHRGFAAQLQFGFPAGVRLQVPLFDHPNRSVVAEGFVGAEWTVLTAMLGLRTIFMIPYRDSTTAFVVGPGAHAVYFNTLRSNAREGGGVVVDTTLGWVFDRQARGAWEIGFNLGLGLMVHDRAVFPIPTFGIFGGLHF